MLSTYLNQTAEYKPCTGTDGRGESIFGTPVTISCRKQAKTQNVLTATGQVLQSQHVYLLKQAVAVGDMLDGSVVMAVNDWHGLFGEVIGYKAVV